MTHLSLLPPLIGSPGPEIRVEGRDLEEATPNAPSYMATSKWGSEIRGVSWGQRSKPTRSSHYQKSLALLAMLRV